MCCFLDKECTVHVLKGTFYLVISEESWKSEKIYFSNQLKKSIWIKFFVALKFRLRKASCPCVFPSLFYISCEKAFSELEVQQTFSTKHHYIQITMPLYVFPLRRTMVSTVQKSILNVETLKTNFFSVNKMSGKKLAELRPKPNCVFFFFSCCYTRNFDEKKYKFFYYASRTTVKLEPLGMCIHTVQYTYIPEHKVKYYISHSTIII